MHFILPLRPPYRTPLMAATDAVSHTKREKETQFGNPLCTGYEAHKEYNDDHESSIHLQSP